MWKTAAAGAAALVIAGSVFVYAQQRPGFGGPRDIPRLGDWRPSAQDLNAFADARIAALHAGLELNADQEKGWPTFEQALREFAKMRIDRLSAARDQQQAQPQQAPSDNPIERLQRCADAMTERGAALKRLADAAAPLYQSLDDAQKRRFAVLARFMRPRERGRMMWRERFGDAHGEFERHGGPGGPGGMHGQGFGMNPHGFRDDPHGFGGGMRHPHDMGGMGGTGDMGGTGGMGGRDDDGDYRGPL